MNSLTYYLTIGLGGASGAILRVLIAKIIPSTIFINIPFTILFINILGCFFMGLITQLISFSGYSNSLIQAFLIPGLLGGFTTFSAFALDFGTLIEKNFLDTAIFYVLLSVGVSLIAFLGGVKIIKLFF